ncbi:MAG: heme-binding protein [Reichenbachiella sp.]|uniref:heme-binding protein n=1 Tax=Reichenbachiella sp. TaxID=2184521 RepID=UPI003266DC09
MSNNENLRASTPKLSTAEAKKVIKTALGAKAPSTLGPLTELPGKWVGKGFNLIALPDFAGGTKFRVKLNAINETLEFTDDVGPIPNRGNTQPDITYLGLRYLQTVEDAQTGEGLHIEPGLWINLPANDVQKEATVARMGTVPHGDSLLAQGPFFTFPGAPQFGVADATPFTLDPNTGARINDTSEAYLKPYTDATPPPGIPKSAILDPNQLLIASNKEQEALGRKIVNTIVMQVNASPIGGINGTPVTKDPGTEGGIVNIPFVVKNADANSMSAIFWINTLENPDGSQFLQLQYTQTVILDFPVPGADGKTMVDIKWPHITVGTLTKR